MSDLSHDMTAERKGALFTQRVFLILGAFLALAQAWAGRYAINPDGMSYLDLGDAYLRHDWARAGNGYWSPLYSWLTGATLAIFRPSMQQEFPVVHLTNFLVFLMALLSFRFFLRAVLDSMPRSDSRAGELFRLPEWLLLALGYSLFLWCSFELITLWDLSPDLVLSALIYLVAGVLVRLAGKETPSRFLLLGLFLGAAYLTKGVMFPLGLAFLAITLVSGRGPRARLPGVLLAFLVFLAVSAPLVVALSRAKGRLTFGDTGKLAYAWCVSPGSFWRNWQGQPPGSGVPLHPTRRILAHPPLFEFGEPVGGTYPPWYDPSYWNDGTRPRFNLRAQLRVLSSSALLYLRLFLRFQPGLLAGVIVLLLMGRRNALGGMAPLWPLVGVTVAALGIYAPVLAETRYVGAYLVLFWCAILAGVRLPGSADNLRLARYVGIAILITLLLSVAETSYRMMAGDDPNSARKHIRVAAELQRMGLREGDRLAVIGDGTGAYWARLGRYKIVAEIMGGGMGAREFWAASPELKASAYDAFRSTGAHAVITWEPPPGGLDDGWERISETDYYVRFFSQVAGPNSVAAGATNR